LRPWRRADLTGDLIDGQGGNGLLNGRPRHLHADGRGGNHSLIGGTADDLSV